MQVGGVDCMNVNNCENCGAKLEEHSIFCSKCGFKVNQKVNQTPHEYVQSHSRPNQYYNNNPIPYDYTTQSGPQKKNTGLVVGLIVIGVVLIGLILLAVFVIVPKFVEYFSDDSANLVQNTVETSGEKSESSSEETEEESKETEAEAESKETQIEEESPTKKSNETSAEQRNKMIKDYEFFTYSDDDRLIVDADLSDLVGEWVGSYTSIEPYPNLESFFEYSYNPDLDFDEYETEFESLIEESIEEVVEFEFWEDGIWFSNVPIDVSTYDMSTYNVFASDYFVYYSEYFSTQDLTFDEETELGSAMFDELYGDSTNLSNEAKEFVNSYRASLINGQYILENTYKWNFDDEMEDLGLDGHYEISAIHFMLIDDNGTTKLIGEAIGFNEILLSEGDDLASGLKLRFECTKVAEP